MTPRAAAAARRAAARDAGDRRRLRTAAVWIVGTATLSTPVGATSLGNYIFSGLQTRNLAAVLVGCVAAAALALLLDRLVRALESGVSRAGGRGVGARRSSLLGALVRAARASRAAWRPHARGRARDRDRRQDLHRAVHARRAARGPDRARDGPSRPTSCRRSARRSPSTRCGAARSTRTSTTPARIWATMMQRDRRPRRAARACWPRSTRWLDATSTAIERRGRARLRERLRARDARATARAARRRAHQRPRRRTRRGSRSAATTSSSQPRGVARRSSAPTASPSRERAAWTRR